jgi:hypothetical protein
MTNQEKSGWLEFRESGMLWWVNRIIHTFGWSITCNIDAAGNLLGVYPKKVSYRGFSETDEDEGFIKISKHMVDNVDRFRDVTNS